MLSKFLGFLYGVMRSSYYKRRYSYFRSRYGIQSNFRFDGTDIRIYGEGKLELGNNSYIGSNSTLQLDDNSKISIGYNCQISHNVRIYTSSADPNQDFTKKKANPTIVGDVIIGNGVWIGANVFINPGIIIEDNAVIGANSVVTKNIPKNAIFGGVPAKLIRYKTIK